MYKFKTEKEFQEYIYENVESSSFYDALWFQFKDDPQIKDYKRTILYETNLGRFGRADLIIIEEWKDLKEKERKTLNIIELKNVRSTFKDVEQLLRYRFPLVVRSEFTSVKCTLIAPSFKITQKEAYLLSVFGEKVDLIESSISENGELEFDYKDFDIEYRPYQFYNVGKERLIKSSQKSREVM